MPLFMVFYWNKFIICYSKTCEGGNSSINCKTCDNSKNRSYNSSTGECIC